MKFPLKLRGIVDGFYEFSIDKWAVQGDLHRAA